jgi:RHS repeat-associated protein
VDGNLVQAWLYGDQLNPVAELDSLGNVVSRFVYASKANVPDYVIQGSDTLRVISDHLGSVRLVVNANTGVVVQRISYDAWGRALEDTNPGVQPFGFAGGLLDPLTALNRFGVRDYDPLVGRWTARDPAGFGGGSTNLYEYVASHPTGAIDPSGLAFYLVWHTVAGRAQHASIWWQAGEGPFDIDASVHITFGAGNPSLGDGVRSLVFTGPAGDLVAGINRPKDYSERKNGSPRLNLPEGVCDRDMLRRLLELTRNFQGGPPVPYSTEPGRPSGEYNSNSYARGLAEAAGFTNVPAFPDANLPGWHFPLPASYFAAGR